MKNIITYADGHQHTQLTMLATSEVGIGVLNDMQKQLDFAGEELKRMENESGIPLSLEQLSNLDLYSRLKWRIRRVLRRVRRNLLI
jgi:hypothetical protein